MVELQIAILFVWRIFTLRVSHADTCLENRFTRKSRREIKNVPSAVILSALPNPPVMRWELTEGSLLRRILLASPPHPSAPTSGLHFPFSPRLQDVCVLAHLSESTPRGCWWLSLGLTPVTAPHNGPFPPTWLSSEWSSAHQTLISSTHQKALKLVFALLWLHAQRQHFQTYTHSLNTWLDTHTSR